MPFQRPQLLEAHLPHGPVEEQHVHIALVPVLTEPTNLGPRALAPNVANIVWCGRRLVRIQGRGAADGAVAETGHLRGLSDVVDALPDLGEYKDDNQGQW